MCASPRKSSWFIEALPDSRIRSYKPHHLDIRMKARNMRKFNTSDRRQEQIDTKRGELLEEKKRKLSDRIRYVKGVQQRHRQQKEQQAREKRELLNSTLQQAELKKQEFLCLRQQSCAEIVKEAKNIAKKQNIKSTEDSNRIKQKLQQRERSTTWRRRALLRTPKSRLPNAEEVLRERAATFLQLWWRKQKIFPILMQLEKDGVNVKVLKKKSFQETVNVVQDKSLIKSTSRFLARLKKTLRNPVEMKTPARIFLSSFMIVNHTADILPESENGPIEAELISAAKCMLEAFSNFRHVLHTANFLEDLFSFTSTWVHYHFAFEAWRSQDVEKLVSNLISHYIELERMWENVRQEYYADHEWKPSLQNQQNLVKQKLFKIAGEKGMKRLEEELKEEGLMIYSEPGDSVIQLVNDHGGQSKPSSIAAMESDHSHVANDAQNEFVSRTISLMGYDSQQITNQMLAHEIALDPDFRLHPPVEDSFIQEVKKMATKAFYDRLRELASTGDYRWVADLLAELKEPVKVLAGDDTRTLNLIEETFDIDLIRQQINNAVFDFNKCRYTFIHILLSLCAPVRDEPLRELLNSTTTDIPSFFESLKETIDLMKIDIANFRLQQLRPYLKSQVIQYESSKFAESLAAGAVTLDKTESWLTKAATTLSLISASRNPENISHASNKLKYEDVYHEALLSLLFSDEAVDRETIPETLILDDQRLFNLQNEIQTVNIIAALVMLARNVMNREKFHESAAKLSETLLVLIKDPTTTIDNLSAQLIGTINDILSLSPSSVSFDPYPSSSTVKAAPPTTLDSSQQKFIRSMVSKTLSTHDPLYILLTRRILSAVKTHLKSGKFKKEGLANSGLDVVAKELEMLSDKIVRLAKHNKEVYKRWYDEILARVV